MDVDALFERVGRHLYTIETVEGGVGVVLCVGKGMNGGVVRSAPCPTHLSLGQLAACLASQEGHLGQVAVGIAGSEERGGVCGDEHVGSDHDGRLGRGKGVVFDGALRCITVDEVAAFR